MEYQKTIAKPVELGGVGLFFGEEALMRCLPAPPDQGVRFVRTDLPSAEPIPATVESVPTKSRWVALKRGNAEVNTVEHLMAVLSALGVDNITIEVSGGELPVGDGSAKIFLDALTSAGLVEQENPRSYLSLESPLFVTRGDALIVALPWRDGFRVSYTLDYDNSFCGAQYCDLVVKRESFEKEIALSRTYALSTEIEAFRSQGLGKGATPENVIVLSEDGSASLPLRYPNEFARHKVLDIIGDLYLAGGPIKAHIVAVKSGHTMNIELARLLRRENQAPASEKA